MTYYTDPAPAENRHLALLNFLIVVGVANRVARRSKQAVTCSVSDQFSLQTGSAAKIRRS